MIEAGKEPERSYAKKIYPLRERGNLLLCTLLMGNVCISLSVSLSVCATISSGLTHSLISIPIKVVLNNTLAVFLDQMVGGIIAIVASSAAIVLFAEIIPQAICGRHRLWTGAKTYYLTWIFLVLMSPVTWPVSKVRCCCCLFASLFVRFYKIICCKMRT